MKYKRITVSLFIGVVLALIWGWAVSPYNMSDLYSANVQKINAKVDDSNIGVTLSGQHYFIAYSFSSSGTQYRAESSVPKETFIQAESDKFIQVIFYTKDPRINSPACRSTWRSFFYEEALPHASGIILVFIIFSFIAYLISLPTINGTK